MLKDNEQQRAFIKLVCFTQVFTYLGVVIVSGILYMLLNMQLTADQLRFIFITYGWESIIALGIIIFFSIRWLNPIVKYANLLKTASEQNPLDVQKIYVKAVRFPLDISILSSLTVFSLFVMCFLQLGVFLNGNSQQILQGLILAIATSIGIGIVSILVNERLIAHYVAELYQKQLSNRISLPLQAKIITVSCFLVLLSIFFLASAQYKNYSSRIKDFVESRAFYELNILKAAYKAQQNTSEWTTLLRNNLQQAVTISPQSMFLLLEPQRKEIEPITKNINMKIINDILNRYHKNLEEQKEGFWNNTVTGHYVTFIDATDPGWKLLLVEPHQMYISKFNPFAGTTIGTMLLVFGFAAILSFYVAGNIRRQVESLSKLAERVTVGKLNNSLDYVSTDELGWLSVSMYEMVGTLAESIKRLGIMAGHIGVASSQIAASVDENEKISNEQVTELGTTIETLDKLRQSGQNVFEESRHVRELVENATQTILLLSEKTGEVGEMSDTINEIAEQINMLSLNASIEAARAGEQGKGFAVVADEIRELADRTNQFTVVISKLIDDIQSSARNTILSTEKMVSGVRHISLSVEQQSEGTRRIVESIEHMNQGFQQMAISGQEVGVSVMGLKDMAEEIRRFIDKFELNGRKKNTTPENQAYDYNLPPW